MFSSCGSGIPSFLYFCDSKLNLLFFSFIGEKLCYFSPIGSLMSSLCYAFLWSYLYCGIVLQYPVYFAFENDEIHNVLADIKQNDAIGQPATATTGGSVGSFLFKIANSGILDVYLCKLFFQCGYYHFINLGASRTMQSSLIPKNFMSHDQCNLLSNERDSTVQAFYKEAHLISGNGSSWTLSCFHWQKEHITCFSFYFSKIL